LAHQAGVISLACTTQGNSSISTSPGQSWPCWTKP
jgi:hypothetical protein